MDSRYGSYQIPFQQIGITTAAWPLPQGEYERGPTNIVTRPSPLDDGYGRAPFGFNHIQRPATVSGDTMPSLPQPAHILKSQDSSTQCLICARFACTLVSHKYFAEAMKSRKHSTQPAMSAGLTPKLKSASLSVTIVPKETLQNAVQYPLTMDFERQNLLEIWSRPFGHERRGVERHLFPYKFIDLALPYARKHAPLFQAMLSMSSSLSSLAHGQVDEASCKHQNTAVQLLSQTCPDERSASSDECIFAALIIMLTFMTQANTTEADRHMSGINHLVLLRGGPHYLGLSGLVAETLLYADYMHAFFFDRPLVWSMPLPALEIGPETVLGRGFDQALHHRDLNHELVRAAKTICHLSEIFKEASAERPNYRLLQPAGYLTSVGEFQLTRCNTVYHGTSSRDECVCLALLLYNHVVLRDFGSISPFVRKIEYQFWTCLQSSENLGVWKNSSPELLMWVLLIGISTEIRGKCKWKPQAAERLRPLRKQLKISAWEDVKAKILDQFCWLSAAQEPVLKAFWMDKVIVGA